MPVTQNISQQTRTAISNPNLRSVRGWLYRAPMLWQPGNMPAEDATLQTARFLVFEGFDGSNGTGNSLGFGSVDSGVQTVLEYAHNATTVEDVLREAFGT